MTDPKDFLARWSQRKLNPATEKSAPEKEISAPEKKTTSLPNGDQDVPSRSDPEFDITSLPSLESIGANSDVRAFLQRGVPATLTRAALRRAWSADPAIRDFVGLSENSWDFNAPDSMPGFGPLSMDEARRVAAQFFSEPAAETTAQEAATEPQGPEGGQNSAQTKPASAEPDSTCESSVAPAQQHVMDVAVQHEKQREPTDEPSEVLPPPRRHGGALPQ
jgi:Protein of unknown function (DUF3306)